jgi:hypothetical protein
MQKPSHLVVRILLCAICVYHVVAGIIATFFLDLAVQLGAFLFGVRVTMDGQTELLSRYLGAFGISFGVLAAFAAIEPQKNRKIIYGLVVYFLVRAFDRIAFWGLLEEYSVGPAPNWFRIVMILVMGLGLLAFMPRHEPIETAKA